MKRTGLTAKVKEVAARCKGEYTAAHLVTVAGCITRKECRRVYTSVIPELVRQGLIRRVSKGVYENIPKETPRTLLDVVWHLVRSHRQFSIDEIERLSEGRRGTVRNYLDSWAALGYLRKLNRTQYQLINDTGPTAPRALVKRVHDLKRQEPDGAPDGAL